MSWFNINVNESLNTLKGQISNVSNVVHDVFTEGILEEPSTSTETATAAPIKSAIDSVNLTTDDEILIGLEEANRKIDELHSQCEAKDNEIVKLQQQIVLLSSTPSPSSSTAPLAEGTASAAATAATPGQKLSKADQHGTVPQSNLEDSWFWESEKAVSSDSSKENDGASASARKSAQTHGDDAKAANVEHPRIVDSLRRSLDEKDAEIQRLVDENLDLNEKIKFLHRESIENDKRLDELDQQHNEALQNLILIKNELQENVMQLKSELDAMQTENVALNEKLGHLIEVEASNNDKMDTVQEIEAKYKESMEQNHSLQAEVDRLQAQLNEQSKEISDLNAVVEEKEAHSRDGSDKFELVELEMTSSMEIARLQSELDEINQRLAILKDIKDQYDSNVVKLSSVVSEKASLEDEVQFLKAENQRLLDEMQLARESVDKLEVLQKTLDAINSDKEQNELAFVKLQDDDLAIQQEFDQLRADKEELESTRSTQGEQIGDLEAKCVELEEKLSQLNETHEKLKFEHAECSERIGELQAMHDTLKTQAVNLESSLVEENMKTQKQVIDLQSALNSKNASDSNPDSITFDELKSLLSKSLSYEPSPANNTLKLYLDAFLRSVKEAYQHLSDIESNRDSLMKQFENVSTEKATLQHEYKTLKADLHHYEKEVAELMKNNGILLNQLENVKAGKLETISEHNEDSILRMELQLEETNKLNASLQEEFKNLTHKLDESEEEKYELAEKINVLQQQLDQMRTDDSKLEMQQGFETKFKAQNEKISELTRKMETLSIERNENQRLCEEIEQLQQSKQSTVDALNQLQQKFDDIEAKYTQMENTMESDKIKYEVLIDELNKTIDELQQRASHYDSEQTQAQFIELQQKIEQLSKEKHELVNAIQMKHNENVQYHEKIQELNQMLMTLQQTIATQTQQLANCAMCAQLTEKVTASHNEIALLTDQVTFLKEKSDILAQNLLIEQNNQKMLAQEKIQLNDEKQALAKDLNRLREHLMQLENAHTAEMIELQNMLELTRQEVAAMQEEARKSNTAYTSASIRANQHTETIQAQYAILQQQKDELSARLSDAEDRESKNKAALINLQCVLEQFQKDKERDVEAMTNRIRNELNDEVAKRHSLLKEIEALKSQLEESKAGLLAAARISDQLEIAQVTNATIKEELRKTQDKFHSAEAKLQETESNQADRVDKSLLKNLLIGYIMAPNNDKQQILKLISSVLDFNQQESDKVGLNRTNQGWLNSILHGSTLPNANQTDANYNKASLAEAFVKFLENESRPRSETDNAPSLLSMSSPPPPPKPATGDESTVSGAPAPTAVVQPIMLPDAMLQTFTTPRNSSSILKDILNDS